MPYWLTQSQDRWLGRRQQHILPFDRRVSTVYVGVVFTNQCSRVLPHDPKANPTPPMDATFSASNWDTRNVEWFKESSVAAVNIVWFLIEQCKNQQNEISDGCGEWLCRYVVRYFRTPHINNGTTNWQRTIGRLDAGVVGSGPTSMAQAGKTAAPCRRGLTSVHTQPPALAYSVGQQL